MLRKFKIQNKFFNAFFSFSFLLSFPIISASCSNHNWLTPQFNYELIDDKNISITGLNEELKLDNVFLNIHVDGYNIVEIETNAFRDNENISHVNFPSSIQVIGESSFENCFNLQDINFPKSIKTIEKYAFANTGLVSVIFEDFDIAEDPLYRNILEIKEGSFTKCHNLELVIFSRSLYFVETNSFFSGYLTKIYFAQTIPYHTSKVDQDIGAKIYPHAFSVSNNCYVYLPKLATLSMHWWNIGIHDYFGLFDTSRYIIL